MRTFVSLKSVAYRKQPLEIIVPDYGTIVGLMITTIQLAMTIEYFLSLSEIEKVAAIMQYGRLLAQNLEDECRIFLYEMDRFYVSTRYTAADDQLKEITTYTEVKQIIPHFRKMLISIHPAERAYSTPER